MAAQCVRELGENKIEVTKNVDSIILATCKRVKEKDLSTDEYIETLKALAKLIRARALL